MRHTREKGTRRAEQEDRSRKRSVRFTIGPILFSFSGSIGDASMIFKKKKRNRKNEESRPICFGNERKKRALVIKVKEESGPLLAFSPSLSREEAERGLLRLVAVSAAVPLLALLRVKGSVRAAQRE